MLIKIRPLWAFLVCCLLLAATTDGARKKTRKRVVCYYTNWSVYRLGLAKYLPSNINPHLCTHLVYAFGGFDDDFQLQPFDKYQDIEKGGYARFNGLKQYNKGLRTLLALGGWSEGSGRFSELVADPDNRQRFIYSVLRYLRQYNFDGLDLDWEYPGSRAGSDFGDKENYATLLEELRAAFEDESVKTNRPTLLLTVAVPAGISTIEKGFNVPRLNAAVDFFNILAYDYHASTEALTDHHAPLFALPGASEYDHRTQLNVDYTVRFYLKLGAERRKLVVGIPTYGRSYTLIDENFSGVQASAESPGLKGKYTKEEGYLSFYEVCENVAVEEWSVYRPYPEEMGPYATKGKQWVGYDDEFIVRKKAEYVRDNRLGGIMFWSIDNDDFRGRCSGKPYPLIEAAKEAYLAPIPGSPPKQAKGPTPAPPVTPDPGADFSCKREGFYPHPEECNKYFWCLAGGALGVVPHSFTCPSGLLFNRRTDACDFPRNVKCKIAVKETVSITFPPTKEPVVGIAPNSAPGEVTEDPLDDYYEDYDPADLPPLDLDFPDTGLSPARPVPSSGQSSPPEVLGGSRGGASSAKTEAGSAAPEEEESDPSELKQILQLIQKIGGVDGVKKLLEGDSGDPASPQISEKTRKTLNKIVGETPKQSSRPQYTSIARGRRPTTSSAETSSAAERTSTRTNSRTRLRTSSSSSRRRQPSSSSSSTSSRGSTQRRRPPPRSQETEVTTGSRSNARRRQPQASRGQEETEVASSGRPNARRRPQYSSIQRNRRPQPTESAIQEQEVQEQEQEPASGPGQRRYVTLNRQRGVQRTSAAAEQEEQQQGEIDPDTGREYVSLRRNRPTTPVPPLEGTSAPRRQPSRRGRPQVTDPRPDAPADPALVLLNAFAGRAPANSDSSDSFVEANQLTDLDAPRDDSLFVVPTDASLDIVETPFETLPPSPPPTEPETRPPRIRVRVRRPQQGANSGIPEAEQSVDDPNGQRRVKVVRLKRPRNDGQEALPTLDTTPPPPPTSQLPELSENEVTVDNLEVRLPEVRTTPQPAPEVSNLLTERADTVPPQELTTSAPEEQETPETTQEPRVSPSRGSVRGSGRFNRPGSRRVTSRRRLTSRRRGTPTTTTATSPIEEETPAPTTAPATAAPPPQRTGSRRFRGGGRRNRLRQRRPVTEATTESVTEAAEPAEPNIDDVQQQSSTTERGSARFVLPGQTPNLRGRGRGRSRGRGRGRGRPGLRPAVRPAPEEPQEDELQLTAQELAAITTTGRQASNTFPPLPDDVRPTEAGVTEDETVEERPQQPERPARPERPGRRPSRLGRPPFRRQRPTTTTTTEAAEVKESVELAAERPVRPLLRLRPSATREETDVATEEEEEVVEEEEEEEKPVLTGGLQLRRPGLLGRRQRPDPLARNRQRPSPLLAGRRRPGTTEQEPSTTTTTTTTTETATAAQTTTEGEEEATEPAEKDIPRQTVFELRSRQPDEGPSRPRPFPFRPPGGRRTSSLRDRLAGGDKRPNPFISPLPTPSEKPSAEPSSTASTTTTTSTASTTTEGELRPFESSELSLPPGLVARRVNGDVTEPSTRRPLFRQRPSAPRLSLSELVKSRENKKPDVQSLVEQLRSSLAGQTTQSPTVESVTETSSPEGSESTGEAATKPATEEPTAATEPAALATVTTESTTEGGAVAEVIVATTSVTLNGPAPQTESGAVAADSATEKVATVETAETSQAVLAVGEKAEEQVVSEVAEVLAAVEGAVDATTTTVTENAAEAATEAVTAPADASVEEVSRDAETAEPAEPTEAPTIYATEAASEAAIGADAEAATGPAVDDATDTVSDQATTESKDAAGSDAVSEPESEIAATTTDAPGSNRDGRVFVVGPSVTTSSQRPVIFGNDGAVIITAATLPPPGASGGDSFVSVKVSVSSEQEAPPSGGITTPKPSVSPVEALFTMWADDSARPTSPLPRGEPEGDAANEDGELEHHDDHEDHDDHADHADHADHDQGGAQSSSLLNKPPAVLASSGDRNSAVESKESLLDKEEVLAYSTVTPRYRDPDSLFKRKTFIQNSAPSATPGMFCWTVALGAVLMLRWL